MSESKTFVFATCYINSAETLERYCRWLDFYKDRFETLHLIDDSSSMDYILELKSRYKNIRVHTFAEHLGRPTTYQVYGWLRNFNESLYLAKQNMCNKIIHIESDLFIFNDEIFEYMEESSSGWHVAWDLTWSMPESSLQIINEDRFKWFEWYAENNYRFINSNPSTTWYKQVEYHLPYTNILKEFHGGRFFEGDVEHKENYTKSLDYVSNLPVSQTPQPIPVHR